MTDYFALLDQARRPWLDAESLKTKFFEVSAEVHPDRSHGASETEKQITNQRYVELNAAYSCLREPKTRLQHLLELESGTKPKDIQQIPQGTMELFVEVGQLCRTVDNFLAERASVTSPVLKVKLFERAQGWIEQLNAVRKKLTAKREGLDEELKNLDAAWDTGSAARSEAALPLSRLEAALARLQLRWAMVRPNPGEGGPIIVLKTLLPFLACWASLGLAGTPTSVGRNACRASLLPTEVGVPSSRFTVARNELPGVRPSPVAATSVHPMAEEDHSPDRTNLLAAPEDGRTPRPPANWPEVLQSMPLSADLLLNRDNCIPLTLGAFRSNGVVKALIFLPAVADDFYLISRDQPKLNLKAANLLAAITALTNSTSVRATFNAGFLLLHLDRDHLDPRILIEDKATAERLKSKSHLPHALWVDTHWERVQPQFRDAFKLTVLPAPKSTDAWHFARHNLAAWNLTDWDLLAALSLAEKTTISIQKNRLVFRFERNAE